MQFVKGLFGPGPKIEWYNNTLCNKKSVAVVKIKSLALVKTKGSLGTFKIECVKVALGALALLAACLISAPLSFIFVGVGSVCLYTAVKRYGAGPAGELKAEASINIKRAVNAVHSAANTAADASQDTTNAVLSVADTATNAVNDAAGAVRNAANSFKNAADSAAVVFHGVVATTPPNAYA